MSPPSRSSVASTPAANSTSHSSDFRNAKTQVTTTTSSITKLTARRLARPPGAPVDRRKRLAANARERKRMNLLNSAYDQLRRRLNDSQNKSKYDVLVQAKEYIQALAKICADFDQANPEHPAARAKQSEQLSCAAQEPQHQHLNLNLSRQYQHHSLSPADNAASSDCMSPMSLADSVISSTSSSQSGRAHLLHSPEGPDPSKQASPIQMPATQLDFPLLSKAAYLLQTNAAQFIKPEREFDFVATKHQQLLYHQHPHAYCQSFHGPQRQNQQAI